MSRPRSARDKIRSAGALARVVSRAQRQGRKVVFTNGCFDLVHAGHVKLLERARALGDLLVVGVNSDRSVRLLKKGPGRPVMGEQDRALLLAALECVSYVTIFNERTPQKLIERLRPRILLKGADWDTSQIVGRNTVERYGGRVVRIPLVKGYSTTRIIERIRRTGHQVTRSPGHP